MVQQRLKYACEEKSFAVVLAYFAPRWLGFVHRYTTASANSCPDPAHAEPFKIANATTICCFSYTNPNFHCFHSWLRECCPAADFKRLLNTW
jgi:hypothetical protein